MPLNREPLIYPGYVISLIGHNAGEEEPMEFGTAQACVSSGTHRWHDDPTDLPNGVRMMKEERDRRRAAEINADAVHAQALKEDEADIPTSKELQIDKSEFSGTIMLGQSTTASLDAERIEKGMDVKGADGVFYIRQPWPQKVRLDTGLLAMGAAFVKPELLDGRLDTVTFNVANASAVYKAVAQDDDVVFLELADSRLPEVEIPADWRELHHFKQISLAKTVRGLDKDAAMTKVEAEAILEEWTASDDTVRKEGRPAVTDPRDPAHPEAGNRQDTSPEAGGDPVARVEERTKEFVEAEDDF